MIFSWELIIADGSGNDNDRTYLLLIFAAAKPKDKNRWYLKKENGGSLLFIESINKQLVICVKWTKWLLEFVEIAV